MKNTSEQTKPSRRKNDEEHAGTYCTERQEAKGKGCRGGPNENKTAEGGANEKCSVRPNRYNNGMASWKRRLGMRGVL